MLTRKDKKNSHSGGFLGAAKTTKKPLYIAIARTPDMYPFGEKSNFITPSAKEDREKSPKGIKR